MSIGTDAILAQSLGDELAQAFRDRGSAYLSAMFHAARQPWPASVVECIRRGEALGITQAHFPFPDQRQLFRLLSAARDPRFPGPLSESVLLYAARILGWHLTPGEGDHGAELRALLWQDATPCGLESCGRDILRLNRKVILARRLLARYERVVALPLAGRGCR